MGSLGGLKPKARKYKVRSALISFEVRKNKIKYIFNMLYLLLVLNY
ncbi:hypothetical protein BPUTEOMOX_1191 [methanotrophic endosymbiont of Bathymodiolus puteoserpentis (Logatchev)]|jgi:hypothetical protein|nr:hypothetical protein BPUTEOMOX_1191 [methanotrophic endosymbiont of Bathymodiolus puteoserpentis (Logatchev)]